MSPTRAYSYICPKPSPLYVCRDGDLSFLIDESMYRRSPKFCEEHERNIISRVLDLVNDLGLRSSFYDVGAAFGLWTVKVGRRVDRNVAIEPDPCMLTLLRGTIEMSGINNVIIIEEALGDREGEVEFCISETSLSSSVAFQEAETTTCLDIIRVKMTTLDALSRRLGVPPQIVKIDVEGFETRVLSGARRSLEESIELIVVENHDKTPRHIEDLLHSYGFGTEIVYYGGYPYIIGLRRR